MNTRLQAIVGGGPVAPLPPRRRGPRGALRRAARGWWLKRHPVDDTPLLTQRNIYLLPTRAGLLLAATLLILLIATINYQLNLGYVLTFLLAGAAAASMIVGHGTLRGLRLSLSPPEPVFAGQPALLEITLINARRSVRYAIGLGLRGSPARAWTDVGANAEAQIQLGFRPARRGLHSVPALSVETRFPIGSFRVWSIWRPAARVLVYPAPEADPPALPRGATQTGNHASRGAPPSNEFDGVRAYRRGDPLKLVVWKKYAKSGELISRESARAHWQIVWLDHATAGITDPEARLSRLTAWVVQADAFGIQYGLRLPGLEIPLGSGDAHRLRCLRALALC